MDQKSFFIGVIFGLIIGTLLGIVLEAYFFFI